MRVNEDDASAHQIGRSVLVMALVDLGALPPSAVDSIYRRVSDGSVEYCSRSGTLFESIEAARRALDLPRRWKSSVISSPRLSQRDQLVSDLVTQGLTTAAVAQRLGVSRRTVTSARQRIRSFVDAVVLIDDAEAQLLIRGRPGMFADLIREYLQATGFAVAVPGADAPNAGVHVLIEPSERDLRIPRGTRAVIVGRVPTPLGIGGSIERGMIALLSGEPTGADLAAAIEAAILGRPTLDSEAVINLVKELHDEHRTAPSLTPRERDVVRGIERGESVKQTARRLSISAKTVENTRQKVFRKLGVRTSHEALVRYRTLRTHTEQDDGWHETN